MSLAACGNSAPDWRTDVASPIYPANAAITPPDPSLRPELAAFVGKWHGTWANLGNWVFLNFILYVNEVHAENATINYCWGTAKVSGITTSLTPGCSGRIPARIDEAILRTTLGNGAKVAYEMRSDGTLYGIYDTRGARLTASLIRFE
jgi:hypothetical protein